MNMRKIMAGVLVSLAAYLCSGCIDVYQHITRSPQGIEHNTLKITVSKLLLAMANGMSDTALDYDAWLEANSGSMDIQAYESLKARIEKVNDELDLGYVITMNLDYTDTQSKDILSKGMDFIPLYTPQYTEIHITALSDDEDTETNEMALAFLSTGKYRLSISKTCISTLKQVLMAAESEGFTEIACLDMGDAYLIEIPIRSFFTKDIWIRLYSV
ncbi:MAG: hypothetical protein LBC51_10065 [Treponema sp.]|jgi:hypothetical protein|nr:hypothetical protein [Treponema sp.]